MSGEILTLARPVRHRRLRLSLALAPATLLAAWLIAAPSGPAPIAFTLLTGALAAAVGGTYAPVGGRPALGCSRCAVVAGASVPAAGLLLSAGRTDPSLLGLAVVVVAFGLVQRLRDPTTCPRP